MADTKFNGTVEADAFYVGNALVTEAEYEVLDGVTAGTATASKAVVLGASKEIATLGAVTMGALVCSGLTIGATAVTATAAELNLTDGQTATAAEVNLAADVSVFTGSYTETSPAAIPATVRVIELAHASTAIEKTIATMVPYAGQFVAVKNTSASGTAAHKVTITTGTWDGTNKVVTLNAPNEYILVHVDSAGNGTIVVNVGSVALS